MEAPIKSAASATGEANIIAHNRHIGVNVGFGSIGNSIRGNAIFGNTSIGIDLGGSGVTMPMTIWTLTRMEATTFRTSPNWHLPP